MAIGHLTYLDLTPEQRQQGAARARDKYRSVLANPFLTNEQVALVHKEIEKIDLWERGSLPVEAKPTETPKARALPPKNALKALPAPPPAPPERRPTHHDVRVADTAKVADKVGNDEGVDIAFVDDDEDLP